MFCLHHMLKHTAIQSAYTILPQFRTAFVALFSLKCTFSSIYSLLRIITGNTDTFINVRWKYSTRLHKINFVVFTHTLRPRTKQTTARLYIRVSTGYETYETGRPSPASEQTVCTRTSLPVHKPDCCCCCVARPLPSNGIPSSSSLPRGRKFPHQKLAVSLNRNSTPSFCLDSLCQRVYSHENFQLCRICLST
jgi:hypothetical protein